MDRKNLKSRAKTVLKKDYVKLLGYTFLVVVLGLTFVGFGTQTDYTTGISSYYFSLFGLTFPITFSSTVVAIVMGYVVIALLVGVLVSPVLTFGLHNAYKVAAMDQLEGYDLFNGFKNNYKNIVIVNLLKGLFICLWALLFIVPGIVKIYQWRYTNQILAENPDMNYKEVLEASENLTKGYKMNLFVLDLSFIGWYILFAILDLLTIGLASYALQPYIYATDAEAYHWLKSLKEPTVIDVEVTESVE